MSEFNFEFIGTATFRGDVTDVYWDASRKVIALCEPGVFPEDAAAAIRGGQTAMTWLGECLPIRAENEPVAPHPRGTTWVMGLDSDGNNVWL